MSNLWLIVIYLCAQYAPHLIFNCLQNFFKTKHYFTFTGYEHYAYCCLSIKCVACGGFWLYDYQFFSKSQYTNMPVFANANDIIDVTRSSKVCFRSWAWIPDQAQRLDFSVWGTFVSSFGWVIAGAWRNFLAIFWHFWRFTIEMVVLISFYFLVVRFPLSLRLLDDYDPLRFFFGNHSPYIYRKLTLFWCKKL